MDKQTARQVLSHPKFKQMAQQKAMIGWGFSAVVFVMYVAYIWLIGTAPEMFGKPVSEGGITTWGVYAGIFVIVFSFITTGIYVSIANGKFEEMTQEVVREVQGEK
ncbi:MULTISPECIES: DUF485 domain-containing protein [Neisseria]|uniref:Inner membrane protein yjcH n=1 Tax=Neisseria musculi TaxID=1815583 RepID=A0A7H1MBE3_9NEIS|nr:MULTISPECIES: DUF485 domain-containing protein [Neisseria]MBF0803388.1 DUF485 domain-containing protein [Neisseria sp. 19428wB4_WF04]QNT58958.1 hypothetical protein H7A79_1281 [Neisseria musculi]TFU43899.1 DUF485 domain-containing protein [Neisseria sp. WF04]